MTFDRTYRHTGLLCCGLALVAGCAAEAPLEVASAPQPMPDTSVYFYPTQGQTAEQQDRDKYECHGWAVQQSGFDPSAPGTPPHLHLRVAAGPPPGTGVAVGAAAGAIVGAGVAPPWEAGKGAVLGAVAGAVVGGIAESAATEHAREQTTVDAEGAQRARLEQQARDYRRAMTACLEGRGYTVH